MSQKTYWRGIEELQETPAFIDNKEAEFYGTELSPLDLMEEAKTANTQPRRDFLKMMGFSVTAATLAASCEMPVRKSIPYLVKPDEIVPGKANYYASAFADGNDFCSIVVKTREGRPIKIEGNTKCPITRGGTSARVQASVLSLYDTARAKNATSAGKEISWEDADAQIMQQLGSNASANIRILSGSLISPTTKKLIQEFTAKYPNTKHISRDAISYSAIITANEKSIGVKGIPSYHFDKADVICSIGADFLGTWISPIQFAKDYALGRKVKAGQTKMSKHLQVECFMSLTGSNADERVPVKPSQMLAALGFLHSKIVGGGSVSIDAETDKALDNFATQLINANGKALVVCGLNDENAQLITNSINAKLGSYGNTITTDRLCQIKQGVDADYINLLSEMKSGAVNALLIVGTNPSYDAHNSNEFTEALKQIPLSISFNEVLDETTQHCKYHLPTNHYLESWGDAEPYTGQYALIQPTIAPLFKTRQYQESLMKWASIEGDFHTYLKNNWISITSETKFYTTLSDGIYSNSATGVAAAFTGDASAALASINTNSTGIDIVLYEKVGIGNGSHANNPWLQELPDPVTKAVWDNYVLVSFSLAEKLGIKTRKFGGVPRTEDDYEYPREVVEIKLNGKVVKLPVLFQPGMPKDTIAIALGYGRTHAGVVGNKKGENVFSMLSVNGNNISNVNTGATVTVTGDTYKVAQTQTHHVLKVDDETIQRTVIREATLKTLDKDIKNLTTERKNYIHSLNESLYPNIEYKNLKWGLNVDLNSCIGCGACAVSCQSENNVAVVGKSEVLRIHEMHWMRIDRYYQGSMDNPKVVFQPVMCQHCDNAPCENVCPVNATNHSSEGLNQMAYNRCIGTRYCANNCPFKVRRFNWLDFMGADSFPANQKPYLGDEVLSMGNDLTRMVLNPDVTVRSRGVIEKCSFCVQRIQEGKLNAKLENRMLVDGDVKTACQTACPTDAITFGNILDKESKIHEAANDVLSYAMLEEINVKPAVTYKMKVRNIETPLYSLPDIKDLTVSAHGGHDEKSEHKSDNHEKKETEHKAH